MVGPLGARFLPALPALPRAHPRPPSSARSSSAASSAIVLGRLRAGRDLSPAASAPLFARARARAVTRPRRATLRRLRRLFARRRRRIASTGRDLHRRRARTPSASSSESAAMIASSLPPESMRGSSAWRRSSRTLALEVARGRPGARHGARTASCLGCGDAGAPPRALDPRDEGERRAADEHRARRW